MMYRTVRNALAGIAAVTLLAACENGDDVAQSPDEDTEVTFGDVTEPEPGTDETLADSRDLDQEAGTNREMAADTGADIGRNMAGAAGGVAENMQSHLENPYALRGHSVNSASGERLGDITALVVDENDNVFAVIDLEEFMEGHERDRVVADIEEIEFSQDEWLLMSETEELESYQPDAYQPFAEPEEK